MTDTDPIFHLAEPADWARSTDTYNPSSVEEEGFIHCSTAAQLPVVARERYLDHNRLILLTIDPDALDDQTLVYEDLEGEGDEFPHVYGPLPTSAVVRTGPYLTHLEEGLWRETRLDREWMDKILHPEFTEVGMSGRTYTRVETLAAAEDDPEAILEDFRVESIDEDVALVRYISHDTHEGVQRHAHRSSIWVNTNQGWRLRFHQGTPLP